ncbi:MAG TPA: ATP-binding protein [Terriglobales bacterium]|nr:ATP-binding protein [Terriglobales bacterium]
MMATPELRLQRPDPARRRLRDSSPRRAPAALRLLQAERSEEVYPILLEEIVGLGFDRTFIVAVDFETGEVLPSASLNCSKNYLDRFRSSLFAAENPVVDVLHSQRPSVVKDSSLHHRSLYCHPILYSNTTPCWEAERERRTECLAVDNSLHRRKMSLESQVCGTCSMRAYAALVAVELPTKDAPDIVLLNNLIEMANRYLSRLFKVEHYYNRMTDMDVTIAQLQTVMQSMSDPVILTDNHYRVIVQNRAAERFFKVPDSTIAEGLTEGLARAVEMNNLLFSAALSSVAVSGVEASRDLTLIDAIEGEEMLFEAVCTPTFTRDGMPLGMVTVMRDVTDLRRADQELRTNYDKLRAAEELVRQDRDRLNVIIESVGDPIVVCDGSAKVALLDPLAQNLFGLGERETLSSNGKGSATLGSLRMKNQAQLDAYVTAFTFGFADKESGTIRLTDPNTKQEIEYDTRSGKIYDERGQVAFTVTVLRDLTALRRVEQLKVERRMLEIEKFAAAGRLAATIAHEVNNPMEAIKNAIYLLSDSVKADAQPVYEILKSETERVARIVRQMLGLYRNNEQVKPINVNTLIEDTLLLLNRQLQRSNIEVTTKLGDLPDAVVAADQLRQVLSNLVINAKDSMPDGGRLLLRTRHVRTSKEFPLGSIRILVADTGSGIPKELQKSIFEPFVTTKGEKGTGLGLWIVRGIIGNHGGKISVQSKVGKGTVFKIELPAVR